MKIIKFTRKTFNLLICTLCFSILVAACSDSSNDDNYVDPTPEPVMDIEIENLERSILLFDQAIEDYFSEDKTYMARYFNPYTGNASGEKASVWMYTSSIEATNAILKALKLNKEKGDSKLYDLHYSKYVALLEKIYDGLEYYMGTYSLTSYTQTKTWSVYGVDRADQKGQARVEGVYNVYDDQMWLVRELVEAYEITGNQKYLATAEYLANYFLDGWDTTINSEGAENGGITWGPGYVTKHACSNGPAISPLVWLADIYKNKADEVEYNYIDPSDKTTRKSKKVKKTEFYSDYAKKIYDWQKGILLMPEGVYYDMRGGCEPICDVTYTTINGVKYRAHNKLTRSEGTAYSYNTGSMISGAVDLYKLTQNNQYLEDAKKMADNSFSYFAKKGTDVIGYYTFETSGFNNWFNGVLMRSYVELSNLYPTADIYTDSFQKNLNYGYENYLYKNLLPSNLLLGWEGEKNDNNMEGMFIFTFATEYALLSTYQAQK